SWGGIQPPWVWSLIALHARGYPLDHPVMKLGLDGLGTFTIEDEAGRRLEACQSPVWDTALAVIALLDGGVPPDHEAIVLAARLPFFDFGAVTDPPSADVTAHMVELLAHEGIPAREGVDWLLRAQEEDGSWFGRWGANYVYGVGAVVPALAATGLAEHESVK